MRISDWSSDVCSSDLALPDLARRGGGKAPGIATKADAEREMAAVEKAGAKQLFLGLPPYPNLLAELEDAPPVITFRGHISLLNKIGRASCRERCVSQCRSRWSPHN